MTYVNKLPDDIDEGIFDTVKLLASNGFNTISSCEGGEGHAFTYPTIIIQPQNTDPEFHLSQRAKIAKTLIESGYSGFTISISSLYQNKKERWKSGLYDQIKVELWTKQL